MMGKRVGYRALGCLLLAASLLMPVTPAMAQAEEAPSQVSSEIYPMLFPVGGPHSFVDTFGAPRSEGRKHQGADIFADKLTPVLAVADGTIDRFTIGDRAGRYIVIEHDDGWRSLYLHLNNDSVGTDDGLLDERLEGIAVGAKVTAGQVIDFVGDSGNAETTSPHLHFELHAPDGTVVNPTPHLLAATGVPVSEIQIAELPTTSAAAAAVVVAAPPTPETRNTELIGHLDPGDGFAAGLAVHSNVVYMGTWGRPDACPASGVRLIDVADPAAPVGFGSIATGEEFPATDTDSVWAGRIESASFDGDLAVVAVSLCDNGERSRLGDEFRGLALYDVSNPVMPKRLSTIHSGDGTQGVHDVDVAIRSDGQIVVAATVMQSVLHTEGQLGDVRLIDITDPLNPVEVGDWDFRRDGPEDEVASLIDVDHEEEGHAHSIAFAGVGRRLWVGNWDAGATLLAIDDLSQPQVVDRVVEVASEEGNLHTVVSDAERGVVVVASEDLHPTEKGIHSAGWGYQAILDLTGQRIGSFYGPAGDPESDDGIPLDGFYTAHDFEINDGLVFTSWYSGGVRVVDLANPADPVEVGYFVPPPAADPQGYWTAPDGTKSFPMVWDVLVDGALIYVSDMNSGLWIARYTGADAELFAGS